MGITKPSYNWRHTQQVREFKLFFQSLQVCLTFISTRYFTSIQINIARLGKSIKISLGAFGVIHIDTGDHSHAGSVVMTLGSRSSPSKSK